MENEPRNEGVKYLGFMERIQMHAVIKEEEPGVLEVHCHGLEEHGHMNFSVDAPVLFAQSASKLIGSLANAVIEHKEKFKAGENCRWGEWGMFTLKEGKDSADSPVLKIVPIAEPCQCEECAKEKKRKGE